MNKIIFYILLPLFLINGKINAQENVLSNIIQSAKSINSDVGKQINMARSHERAGLIKEAELIYSQLFSAHPTNLHVFSSYKSFLTKQENWELLVNVSLIYSSRMGDDPYAKLALADTYLIVNNETEALAIFDELFSDKSSDIRKIKRYLSKLIQYNKIDYAIKKIKRARKAYDNKGFFADKLGDYYYSNMSFEKSLTEYLLYISSNDDYIGQIRKKLMGFPDDPEIKSLIKSTLNKNNTQISSMLLAEYEFKWENYEESFELMINNYNSTKSLHDFAQNLIVVEQLDLAEKIYTHLSKSNNNDIIKMSIYELANILEIKSNKKIFNIPISNSIIDNSFFEIPSYGSSLIDMNNSSITNIVNLYDSLIFDYSHSKAQYKLATLKLKSDYNFESLLIDFIQLEKKSIEQEIRFNSAINIIDLKISNGLADNNLLNQINKYKNKYKKNSQRLLLELKTNQVLFYLKEFDLLKENLTEKIKTISKSDVYYNNFIDGLILIMLFNNNSELEQFSESIYNIKKLEYNKALQGLTKLSVSDEISIANVSLYYLSYIYIMQGNYNFSESILNVINNDDIFSQLTILIWTEIDDHVHDNKNAAIDKYLEFLEKYESSIFYEDIRIRLGEIIG